MSRWIREIRFFRFARLTRFLRLLPPCHTVAAGDVRKPRLSSLVGEFPRKPPQKRASTGGATPSRLARSDGVMERGTRKALQLWACSPALRLLLEPHPHAAGTPHLPTTPRRGRRASGRQTPYSKTMSRPFRASHFLAHSPGRCPGLVCRAPSGHRGGFGWTIIATTQWLAI
jgi:hypothetical protein